MPDSCFAARLSHFLKLTGEEAEALARLEETEQKCAADTVIREQGAPADELYILKSGWAQSHIRLDGGRRQILKFEFPGDLVGASSIPFGAAADTISAVTDCVVCPMDRAALRQLFHEHSRVGTLLFLLSQAERVSMNDRLASIGRTGAKARVAALLLEILNRHRIMHGEELDQVDIPLTQEEIGDATGLTSVHVNRMMQELSREGLISRRRNRVTVVKEKELVRLAEYMNRFAEIDTSWLPPPES